MHAFAMSSLPMKRLLALLFFTSLASAAVVPAIELGVEMRRTTKKTSESGGTSSKTLHYVDRTVLSVSIGSGEGISDVEIACYFVARNVQTHALKYYGFEKQTVAVTRTKQVVQIQSPPASYSQTKDRDATAESKRGDLPFGWIVIVSARGQEIGVKISAPDVLQWVRKNPPRARMQVSP
jgi:hypothetical protein